MKHYYLFVLVCLCACSQKTYRQSRSSVPLQPLQGISQMQPYPAALPVYGLGKEEYTPLPHVEQQTPMPQTYADAYAELAQMLQGAQPQSFKRAVFVTEAAYLRHAFSYPAFCRTISDLAILARAIRKSNRLPYNLPDSSNVQQNYAIYRLLCDTLTFEDGRQLLPYRYDFEDITGQADWTKLFVSKLLVTGSGNCHSLPYLYRIMAEEMQAETYLSLAPNHIYIQTPSQKTGWFNTELTSGTFPRDAWIVASGYISLPTIRNHTYMKPLSLVESIALCVVDLAKGYQQQAVPDWQKAQFMNQCADLALQYLPEGVPARLLKVEALAAQYQLTHEPQTWQELEVVANAIFESGYLEMPEKMYLHWLTQPQSYTAQAKGMFDQENHRKGNGTATMPVLTLSNGQYDEFPQAKPLERIGSVIFDTKARKIAKLYTPDSQTFSLDPVVASRFLSVDPLARSYPFLTPYQFASNTPIAAIDLDGLEAKVSVHADALEKGDAMQFKVEAEQAVKLGQANSPHFIEKAAKFIELLEEKTRKEGSIQFITIFSHSTPKGVYFYDEYENQSGLIRPDIRSSLGTNVSLNRLTEKIIDGTVKFEKNALVIFAGCNCAAPLPRQGGSDLPSYAEEFTDVTGVASVGAESKSGPVTVNGQQIREATNFILYRKVSGQIIKESLGSRLNISLVQNYMNSKGKEIQKLDSRSTTNQPTEIKTLDIKR